MIDIKIFFIMKLHIIFCYDLRKSIFCFSQKFRNISIKIIIRICLFFLLYSAILKQTLCIYTKDRRCISLSATTVCHSHKQMFLSSACTRLHECREYLLFYSIARELSYSIYIYVYRR